jgi:glycosyltransferase involved in cell wall biosynthesis
VVHNWCDAETIAERAGVARSRRAGEGPTVGMVARLDPIKDHETLVRAFALFRSDQAMARLRVVGDGVLRPRLEALAAELGQTEHIEFLGTRLDVPEQLGALDLFAFATTGAEGFGIVLAEAMAACVPIVATDIGPVREVLDDGRAGLLVGPRDPGALAAGMQRVWNDPALRAGLVAAGSALVRERYGSEVAAQRIAALLAENDGPSESATP